MLNHLAKSRILGNFSHEMFSGDLVREDTPQGRKSAWVIGMFCFRAIGQGLGALYLARPKNTFNHHQK